MVVVIVRTDEMVAVLLRSLSISTTHQDRKAVHLFSDAHRHVSSQALARLGHDNARCPPRLLRRSAAIGATAAAARASAPRSRTAEGAASEHVAVLEEWPTTPAQGSHRIRLQGKDQPQQSSHVRDRHVAGQPQELGQVGVVRRLPPQGRVALRLGPEIESAQCFLDRVSEAVSGLEGAGAQAGS